MTTNEAKKMKGKDPCWDGYKMLGTKPKGGKQVPNCIPEETMEENIARLVSNSIKRVTAVKPTPQQKADIRMNREETEDKDPGEYDQEGDMAMTQLRSIIHHAQQLHDQLDANDNLPEWVQNKITLSQDYMQTAHDYMYSQRNEEAVAESSLNELSKDTLKSYAKKAIPDMQASHKRSEIETGKAISTKDDETAKTHYDAAKQANDRTEKRMAGISGAIKRVTKQGVAEEVVQEKRGLWDNIHAKRERIKNGSGEHMRKPGSKGAPTADALRKSAVKEDTVNEISAETQAAYSKASHKDRMTQAVKVIGSSGHDKEAAQKLKVRNAGLKRISDRIYDKSPKVTPAPKPPLKTDYGYGKGRYMGDSVEMQGNKIDELSPATLSSYKKAAGQSASNLDKSADKEFALGNKTAGVALTNKANKRFSGIVRATKKQ
jgi:hypothetical protein